MRKETNADYTIISDRNSDRPIEAEGGVSPSPLQTTEKINVVIAPDIEVGPRTVKNPIKPSEYPSSDKVSNQEREKREGQRLGSSEIHARPGSTVPLESTAGESKKVTEPSIWDNKSKREDKGAVIRDARRIGRMATAFGSAALPTIAPGMAQVAQEMPPQVREAAGSGMENRGPTVAEGQVKVVEQEDQAENGVNPLGVELTAAEIASIQPLTGDITPEAGSALNQAVEALRQQLDQINQANGGQVGTVRYASGEYQGTTRGLAYLAIEHDNVRVDSRGTTYELSSGDFAFIGPDGQMSYMQPMEVEDYGHTEPVIVMMTEELHEYLRPGNDPARGLTTVDGQPIPIPDVGQLFAITGIKLENGSYLVVNMAGWWGEPVAFQISHAGGEEAPPTPDARFAKPAEVGSVPREVSSATPPEIASNYTYDADRVGYVRDNNGITEVWRPLMTPQNGEIEQGWLQEMDVFTAGDMTIILEMNPEAMANRDPQFGRGYRSIRLTDDFKNNYENWVNEFSDNLGNLHGRTVHIEWVPEYTFLEDQAFLSTYVTWEDKAAYAYKGWYVGNDVFIRVYTIGGANWIPGETADEDIFSQAVVYSLVLAASGPAGLEQDVASVITRNASIDILEGILPRHFPQTPTGEGTKLVDLGQ